MELRTAQKLVMTPQLQQAIKLLQLSNLELGDFIEQELEQNPILERIESDDGAPVPEAVDDDASVNGDVVAEESGVELEAVDTVAIELDRVDMASSTGVDGQDAPLDTDFENVFTDPGASAAAIEEPSDSAVWGEVRGAGGSFDADDAMGYNATPTRSVSLKEHLSEQMNVALASPVDRMIGAHLIESLNEAGYLVEATDDIALKLGAEVSRVEAVLGCLQGLDPTGVGARTPAECFALQLREKDRLDPLMQKLLDHLELLGQHDIAALKRRCGVDDEDLAEMIAEIQALDPRPGLAYDHEVAQAVVPDVFVRRSADGAWRVELNGATLPKVLVNRRYASLVERAGCSREERAYLVDQINSANWLVKSLDQRANTILRVASEIVRQQEAFLTHGVTHLKPLNLRAIAEAIEMHESTVSRVTSNKYMATPRGIFELKYFFTSAIASAAAGGEAHSAEAVKHKIRELIDAEEQKAILSDDSLVELLRASGIDIARRTVAKYREAMRIPSSVQRRRQKRLTG